MALFTEPGSGTSVVITRSQHRGVHGSEGWLQQSWAGNESRSVISQLTALFLLTVGQPVLWQVSALAQWNVTLCPASKQASMVHWAQCSVWSQSSLTKSENQRTLGSGRDGGKDRRLLATSLTPDNKDHNNNEPVDGHSTATATRLSVLTTSEKGLENEWRAEIIQNYHVNHVSGILSWDFRDRHSMTILYKYVWCGPPWSDNKSYGRWCWGVIDTLDLCGVPSSG